MKTREQRKSALKYAKSDKGKVSAKRWREKNPERYRQLALVRAKRWQSRNPEYVREQSSAYQASKRKAIPKWADRKAIRIIYAEAIRLTKETGIPHEVDHIVPLRSKFVQGLHCENNLRIIQKIDNIKKGNRTWPDIPGDFKEWNPPLSDRKCCSACHVEKHMDYFYRDSNPRNLTGHQSRCIECAKHHSTEYRHSHPEWASEQDKIFRKRHPDKIRKWYKQKIAARPEHYRALATERQRKYRSRINNAMQI